MDPSEIIAAVKSTDFDTDECRESIRVISCKYASIESDSPPLAWYSQPFAEDID